MNIPKLHSKFSYLHKLLIESELPYIINEAIEEGIFEELAIKDHSSKSLASKLLLDNHVLDALLDVLASKKLLSKKQQIFSITSHAKDYLIKKSNAQQINTIKRYTRTSDIFSSLKDSLHGKTIKTNTQRWSNRDQILEMEQHSKAGILQTFLGFCEMIPDIMKSKKMCDLAGSSGYYSLALMNDIPDLHSHIYELNEVCKIAEDIRKDHPSKNRLHFHPFTLEEIEKIGENFDLFLCSHVLYEYNSIEQLTSFLKVVNKSMKQGGIFISNHISHSEFNPLQTTSALIELQTRVAGYKTHKISRTNFMTALSEAGFGNFIVETHEDDMIYPTLLIAAKKL